METKTRTVNGEDRINMKRRNTRGEKSRLKRRNQEEKRENYKRTHRREG